MIIDWKYFFGERSIAQVTEPSVRENLDMFINKYEPKILVCLLGQQLYDEFITGITSVVIPATDPVEYEPIDQKWLDLLNGCNYIDKYFHKQVWVGIANSTTKTSLIANYVYYRMLGDGATDTSGTGEKISDSQNAKNSNPIWKQTMAWNEMVEWNKGLRLFMQSKTNIYSSWNDPLIPPVYCNCRDFFHTVNNMNL